MRMKELFTPLLAAALCFGACTPRPGQNGTGELTMLVGTYTNGTSTGIYTFRFNQETGQSSPLDSIALPNPSYLTVSADGHRVYAVNEMSDSTASLSTMAFDASNGHLNLLNRQRTHGTDPCYVATNGQMVLTANYGGGSVSVFRLHDNGTAEPLDTLLQGLATGPDSVRQSTPHVHCTVFTPDSLYVFATDFSADRLMRFDITPHRLLPSPDSTFVPLSADTGPRHLTFSPDGRHAYVIGELSGQITALAYTDGQLKPLQTVAADTTGARGSADIHISPDGRFLYASNRLKHDGIAIFAIHPQNGTLTPTGYQPTGRHPRNFHITPNGRYLLVACRDNDVIQVYLRDIQTGLLTDTHQDIHVSQPVCIQFVNKP